MEWLKRKFNLLMACLKAIPIIMKLTHEERIRLKYKLEALREKLKNSEDC